MTFSAEQAREIAKEAYFYLNTEEDGLYLAAFQRALNEAAARAMEGATRYDWGRANSAELEELANEYRTAAQPERKTT